MRMVKMMKGQIFHSVEKINHSVELFLNTNIENFLTVKSSIKWVVKNYLKVLFVTSPLLILSISYLMR